MRPSRSNIIKYRHKVKGYLQEKTGNNLAVTVDNLAHSVSDLSSSLNLISTQMAHNVPAVYDVFLRPDKEKCEAFLRAQKNVAEQKHTKGASPTVFLCSPSRRQAAKHIQTC